MDLAKLAADLLTKHSKKTEHMGHYAKSLARTHYKLAVEHFMHELQQQALDEEIKQKLSQSEHRIPDEI